MNDSYPKCIEKRRIVGFLPEFLPFIKKTTFSIGSMRAISSAFAARLALFFVVRWAYGRILHPECDSSQTVQKSDHTHCSESIIRMLLAASILGRRQ